MPVSAPSNSWLYTEKYALYARVAVDISPARVKPYSGWDSKNISAEYSASPSSCQACMYWSLPTAAYHHWCATSCTAVYTASPQSAEIIASAGYSMPLCASPVCTIENSG